MNTVDKSYCGVLIKTTVQSKIQTLFKQMASELSKRNHEVLHGAFALMNLACLIWFLQISTSYHSLVKYFSLQGFMLTCAYSGLSLLSSTKRGRLVEILYELAFTSEIVITVVYFAVIRDFMITNLRVSASNLYCNDVIHLMPILMLVLINYLEVPPYFTSQNVKYQLLFGVFSIIVNAAYAILDEPVYFFTDFKDLWTFAVFFAVSSVMLIEYLIMNRITECRIVSRQEAIRNKLD